MKKKPTNKSNKNTRKQSKIPPDVALAVWEAEDGRCEMCGRPMDQKVARFRKVDMQKSFEADNLHLLCIDCKKGRPDLLKDISVPQKVVEKIARRTGMLEQAIPDIVTSLLQKYGVIVQLFKKHNRIYWLPGIGTFLVSENPKAEIIKVSLHPEPELIIKSQERTRGLPKPKK